MGLPTKGKCRERVDSSGWATVNSKRANDTIGINLNGKPRLHVPLNVLTPQARSFARKQSAGVSATVPLGELVDLTEFRFTLASQGISNATAENRFQRTMGEGLTRVQGQIGCPHVELANSLAEAQS